MTISEVRLTEKRAGKAGLFLAASISASGWPATPSELSNPRLQQRIQTIRCRNQFVNCTSSMEPPATASMARTASIGENFKETPLSVRKTRATTQAVRLLPSLNP